MPSLFVCYTCSTIDLIELAFPTEQFPVLISKQICTQCRSGKWHNYFERETYNPETHHVVNRPNGIGLG